MSLVCSVLLQVRDAQWNSRSSSPFFLSFLPRHSLAIGSSMASIHNTVTVPTIYSCAPGEEGPLGTMPVPLPSPPDCTSPEGGSSSLLRPVTMCMLRVPQMEITKKSHPPQKEKTMQLAPAMAVLITCSSDNTRHLHALLAMHFSLCRT